MIFLKYEEKKYNFQIKKIYGRKFNFNSFFFRIFKFMFRFF